MTLVELIIALKHEHKHGAGDRELAPSVTVESILNPPPTHGVLVAHNVPAGQTVQDVVRDLERGPNAPGGPQPRKVSK